MVTDKYTLLKVVDRFLLKHTVCYVCFNCCCGPCYCTPQYLKRAFSLHHKTAQKRTAAPSCETPLTFHFESIDDPDSGCIRLGLLCLAVLLTRHLMRRTACSNFIPVALPHHCTMRSAEHFHIVLFLDGTQSPWSPDWVWCSPIDLKRLSDVKNYLDVH